MIKDTFTINAEVMRFPLEGGWYYIEVPNEITDVTKPFKKDKFTKIRATLGNTTWDTALLPLKGKGEFIAIKKDVRKAEEVDRGDQISLSFVLR